MQKWWSILFGVVNLAALLLFVVAYFVPGWWLPKDISTFGWDVDFLFYLILWVTGFFFVLTEALLVYAMWRWAAQPGQKAMYSHGNHKLEYFWTLVTAGILLVVAFSQIRAWEKIKYRSQFPDPDHVFEVSARQFEWRIRYPTTDTLGDLLKNWKTVSRGWSESPHSDDIHIVNDVHTWSGAKVRLFLKTRDVLHSFFLPNLRLKQDAVPGKTIPMWFQVKGEDYNVEWNDASKRLDVRKDAAGNDIDWPIACAELCGWGHYKMQGRLYVHKTKASYEAWLKHAAQEQDRRGLQADAGR